MIIETPLAAGWRIATDLWRRHRIGKLIPVMLYGGRCGRQNASVIRKAMPKE
jgi:hypothetical protein